MKILLYGINFHPEKTGIGKYSGEMAQWLAARGHEVRVVTAPPYYPEWQVHDGYSAGRFVTEHPQPNLRVERAPLWVPAKVTGRSRLLHLASFAATSVWPLLRQLFWRPDAVVLVVPTLACAPGALALGALARARTWLHVQDFEVDAAFELSLLQGASARRTVLKIERLFLRSFDHVSTISLRMLDKLHDKGVPQARTGLFPNWVDLSAIRPLAHSGYREELGICPDRIVALYSGNMGAKQGLETLADTARLLREQPAIHFVLCGNGAAKADLVRRCEGLPNVTFLDLQPMERLNELLALADVHLLPQKAGAADLVMPSKLTGMLASGRPVVATAAPGTELAQVAQHCGLVIPPENAEAMRDAILQLAADPAARARLGEAGREYAMRKLDREAVLGTFESELQSLVDHGGAGS